MAAATVLDFENFTFLTVITVKGAELRHYTNFFSKSLAVEISHVLDFSKWRPSLSWIKKNLMFNGPTRQDGRTASLRQISTKSLQSRPRYGDFSIIQDGGRRHVGFSKFEIF